jgi:hypothetical protein
MKMIYCVLIISALCLSMVRAQRVDVYGYFEPQYNGIYFQDDYYQFQSNKLRIDLKSTAVKNTEFGADVIFLLYFGKKEWNILDFLPENIIATVQPELYPAYQFTYQDSFYLDNVYARFTLSRFALTIGKQQLSLGTGYFTNPTDVFNTKDALDPTYEQPGHNAIRMDMMVHPRVNVMALYTPIEIDWQESGKFMRLKVGMGHFDFSVLGYENQYTTTDFYTLAQLEQRRRLIGADIVGELLGLGIWAEGAYHFLEKEDIEDFYEFVVGTDYTFESGLYAMVEYHHNSQGKSDYNEYDLNTWMRFFVGETKTISRDQMYGFIQYPLTDLLVIGGYVITSISDQSAALVPMIEYSLFNNASLTLMGNFYLGEQGKNYSSALGNGGFLRATVYF